MFAVVLFTQSYQFIGLNSVMIFEFLSICRTSWLSTDFRNFTRSGGTQNAAFSDSYTSASDFLNKLILYTGVSYSTTSKISFHSDGILDLLFVFSPTCVLHVKDGSSIPLHDWTTEWYIYFFAFSINAMARFLTPQHFFSTAFG